MTKLENQNNNAWLLKADYSSKAKNKHKKVEEDVVTKQAKLYLDLNKLKNVSDFSQIAKNLVTDANREYTFELDSFKNNKFEQLDQILYWLTYGLEYAKFDSFTWKNNDKVHKFDHKILISETSEAFDKAYQKALIVSEAHNQARYYQAMAPNIANSEFLAQEIVKKFKGLKNIEVKVLSRKEVEQLGMNLFLSVNAGSVYEPKLVAITYKPNKDSQESLALVGKGITFDSGGYQVKTKKGMPGMKYDMTGSVVAAFSLWAIAKLGGTKNMSAILMLTDNKISSLASTPDTVYRSMNGLSVEVNNTDAEGRLVLADGITYAVRNLKATQIIDIATLTGAVSYCVGETYSGIFSSSQELFDKLENASQVAGELIWQLPLDDEYLEGLTKSKIADLYNSDSSGNAGSCTAAMFLQQFKENADLLHIDIASTAKKNNYSTVPMLLSLIELGLQED
ncbi:M17 family metallopeptidase [Mycoplasma sp. 128]|uniref:M17 family metallopeptidase n=1 Tax=Mycoplasma sp. 3341 TaxID=3447506 RepID=UPI003F654E95